MMTISFDNEKVFTAAVNDEDTLNSTIYKAMENISPNIDKCSPSENNELYLFILKRVLLEALIKEYDDIIKTDFMYLVKLMIGNDINDYSLVRLADDNVESGYSLSHTLY